MPSPLGLLKSLSPPIPQTHPFAQTHKHPELLYLLSRCSDVKYLAKILSALVASGTIKHHPLAPQIIIHKSISLGDPSLALSLHRSVSSPSLFLQNWTIRCLSDHGFHADVLRLYARSPDSLRPRSDNFTFPIVIKACAAISGLRPGREVHGVVLRTGYGCNVGIQTALLDMYAKTGRVDCSRRVFDGMPERDLVSWNALVCGYTFNGLDEEAAEVFGQMLAASLKPNASSLVSVVPLCSRLGAQDLGYSLHGLAAKCGLVGDEAVVPTLISMYSGFEDLASARVLFETVQTKDLVTWNALISACMQNGRSDEAFEVFQLMRSSDTLPNFVTLVSILPSCVNLGCIRHGESVHAVGVKFGLEDQVSVVTALVSMYSKLGQLNAAEYLFYLVHEKTVLLWNSMVSGYVLIGLWCMVLKTFHDMQLDGVRPDVISLISVISGCTMPRDLCSGKSIHAYVLKHGFDSNTSVMNALLALYSDCDQFSSSLKLFHRMPLRNVVSWNILISGWAKMGDVETAVASFCELCRDGWKFDAVTIINILPTFFQVEDLVKGISFHNLAIKSGFDSDISLTNALITMYANCGDLGSGRILFDNLRLKSVVSWNALMTGYRNHNLYGEVKALFDLMKMDFQQPNSVTLLNLLPTCKSQIQGKSVHAYAIRNFSMMESPLTTSTMVMYSRFENLGYCQLLFNVVDKTNLVAWNAMMSVYVQCKHIEEAVASFREMLRIGLEPDPVTVLTLVSAYSQSGSGSVALAQCVMGYVICKGFEKSTSVINSLIDMFARCGSISIANDLFEGLKDKDSITWSVMINGYGMHGNGEAALKLFSEMQKAKVEPDDVTFVSILSACSHGGLVEQGRMLFKSMLEEHKIIPRMEHYACMLDLLGRTGHLDEAYDLLKNLPFIPSASLLESLLGACHCYGNAEVGEKIGKLLLELNLHSSSSYVLLSNICSTTGRWMDSETLRFDMDARGLRKDPGFSLVEAK